MKCIPLSSRNWIWRTFICERRSKLGWSCRITGFPAFFPGLTLAIQLIGIETYRLASRLWELAKNRIVCSPFGLWRIRRFWLMHSSPRPFDLASSMPAIKTNLDAKISSWNCTESAFSLARISSPLNWRYTSPIFKCVGKLRRKHRMCRLYRLLFQE